MTPKFEDCACKGTDILFQIEPTKKFPIGDLAFEHWFRVSGKIIKSIIIIFTYITIFI